MSQTEMFDEDDNILSDVEPIKETVRTISPEELPVSSLGVGPGTQWMLKRHGMTTLGDIIQHSPSYFLKKIDGLGIGKVTILQEALAVYGLKLQPDETEDEFEEAIQDRQKKKLKSPWAKTPQQRRDLSRTIKAVLERKRMIPPQKQDYIHILNRDVKPTKKGFYYCPECERDGKEPVAYNSVRSLSHHRSAMHGVPAAQSHATWYQKRHPHRPKMEPTPSTPATNILTKDVAKGKDGLYHCPECDRGFTTKVTLGTHRRTKHGVKGLKEKIRKDKNYGRRNDTGRTANLPPTKQPIIELRPSDFHQEQPAFESKTEDINHDFFEYSAGYAEGHIRTWIDFYCQQTGNRLSPVELTKRLAELLGS